MNACPVSFFTSPKCPVFIGPEAARREAVRLMWKKLSSPLQIEFKGHLASDRQQPHDIAIRAGSNATYRKEKVPVEQRAKAWLEKHPEVYPVFKALALKVCSSDELPVSGRMLAETMRYNWRTGVTQFRGGSDFKVNDMATPYMVRRFLEEHPEYARRFELRGKGV